MPPLLAIFAEWRNPVSSTAAKLQAKDDVVPSLLPEGTGDDAKTATAEQIGMVVAGAVQVNSIIPTWISVTAAIAQAIAEVGASTFLPVAILMAVWAMISMILFVWFFPNARYHAIGAYRIEHGWFRGKTRAEALSKFMIGCNGMVLVVVLAVALRHKIPGSWLRFPCP